MDNEGPPLPKLKPQTLGEAIAARFQPNLPLLIGLFAAYVSGSLGLGLFSLVVIIWVAYVFFGDQESKNIPPWLLIIKIRASPHATLFECNFSNCWYHYFASEAIPKAFPTSRLIDVIIA
jgi:ABC-type multidrug transport system permease subunit